jgi:alpha-tubulin suppressor-like RCC1 family protein
MTTDRTMPVEVTALGGMASDLSAGELHTCAVVAGAVKCWGSNGSGQIGTGGGVERIPVVVPGSPASVTRIAVGDRHACAITTSGALWCWGDNNDGQVGVGALSAREPATHIDEFMGDAVLDVAAGGRHTCAVIAGGAAYCWGRGLEGQLGGGGTMSQNAPRAIADFTTARVEAGGTHSCALGAAGAFCWGDNTDRQLGNGTTMRALEPSAVSGVTDFTVLSAGARHTCGRRSNGSIACWGTALLGDGTSTMSNVPVTFPSP